MIRAKFIRLNRGISQIKLVELTEISQPDISRFEHGQVNLKPAQLQRLATFLGVAPPERLLDHVNDPGDGLEVRIDGPHRDQS